MGLHKKVNLILLLLVSILLILLKFSCEKAPVIKEVEKVVYIDSCPKQEEKAPPIKAAKKKRKTIPPFYDVLSSDADKAEDSVVIDEYVSCLALAKHCEPYQGYREIKDYNEKIVCKTKPYYCLENSKFEVLNQD